MSFVGVLQQFVAQVAPWFVMQKRVGTLLQSAALVQDHAVETLSQGLSLGHPLDCDESALPTISRDRVLRIYPTEPVESQRLRLSQWWQLKRQFATHQGEMRNLRPYFLPSTPMIRIVHTTVVDGAGTLRSTWHTLNGVGEYSIHKVEPGNWNWDDDWAGSPKKWSRWWCIIYRDALMAFDDPVSWNGGAEWDDGSIWNGGPSTQQIADIVGALKEAQGPHSKLAGVILTSEPASFAPSSSPVTDPDGWTSLPVGNWAFAIDNDTGLPSRPPYASFLYVA